MEGLAQNNGTTSISDLPNNRQTQNSINQQQMQNNNIIMTNTEIVSNLKIYHNKIYGKSFFIMVRIFFCIIIK